MAERPKIDKTVRSGDTGTSSAAADVLSGRSKKGSFARLLPFLGPAFIASVAYVDPGNFATNIQGGAQFGYTLLWVIIGSNLMAHVNSNPFSEVRDCNWDEPGGTLPQSFFSSGGADNVGFDGNCRYGN